MGMCGKGGGMGMGDGPGWMLGKGGGGCGGGEWKGEGGKRRERLSHVPITGRVKEWKSGFGWIVPFENIDHPAMQGSKLYVHLEDCESGHPPPIGSMVTFYVYQDRKGLGAESLRVTGPVDMEWVARQESSWRGGGGGGQWSSPSSDQSKSAEGIFAQR